jgi:hypothetical protein
MQLTARPKYAIMHFRWSRASEVAVIRARVGQVLLREASRTY